MNIMLCGLCGDYFWIYKLICRKSPNLQPGEKKWKRERDPSAYVFHCENNINATISTANSTKSLYGQKKGSSTAKNYCQCAEYRKKVANCICIHEEFSFYPREFSLLFNRTWTNREKLNILTTYIRTYIYITNSFSCTFYFCRRSYTTELNWL